MMNSKTCVIVVGHEKDMVGKTTVSAHCLCYLLYKGCSVASIDLDSSKKGLTTYVNNRVNYIRNQKVDLPMSKHFLIEESNNENEKYKDLQEEKAFKNVVGSLLGNIEYIIIDTVSYRLNLVDYVYSYADIVITPIGENFEDIDIIAKLPDDFDGKTLDFYQPSKYSQLIWEKKMHKIKQDNQKIDWFVVRNKLSKDNDLNSAHKNNVKTENILEILSKKFGFKTIFGYRERYMFRELLANGLTVLDIKADTLKKTTISAVAARQEFKNFMQFVFY